MKFNLLEEFKPYKKGLIIVLCTWGLYFLYMWPKMLFWTDRGLETGYCQSIWSDFPTHFAYTTKFAYQPITEWFKSHPFYYNHKPTHHLLVNLISGLLLRIGVPIVDTIIIPSIITTILLLIALYFFYLNYLKSEKLSILATTLFFSNGGLGALFFFKDILKKIDEGKANIFNIEYSRVIISQFDMFYGNFIAYELFPQRALLLGLPISLIIILKLELLLKKNGSNLSNKTLTIIGILIGLLLIIHPFSYLILLIFITCLFLKKRLSSSQFLFMGLGIFISTYLIKTALFGNELASSKFIQWKPGLVVKDGSALGVLYFWIVNWGLFLPLSIISVIKLKKYNEPIILTALIAFVSCNLFLLSPWAHNNIKFVVWCYLILCIPVAEFIGILWTSHHNSVKGLVIFLIILLTISGAIDLYRITNTKVHTCILWNNDEIQLAEDFKKISSPVSRVLTGDNHTHWVSSLTGRQILVGHKGKLWSWGIDVGKTPQDVANMFLGNEYSIDLLKQYKVNYVVIGPNERTQFHANESFFSNNFQLVLQRGDYKVYKIL